MSGDGSDGGRGGGEQRNVPFAALRVRARARVSALVHPSARKRGARARWQTNAGERGRARARARTYIRQYFLLACRARILVVFGGVAGLEAALKCDGAIAVKRPDEYFAQYINVLPDQGSRTIRTEEAIPIALTALRTKLDDASFLASNGGRESGSGGGDGGGDEHNDDAAAAAVATAAVV